MQKLLTGIIDIHINASVSILKNINVLPQEKVELGIQNLKDPFLWTLNFNKDGHVYSQRALCQCDPAPLVSGFLTSFKSASHSSSFRSLSRLQTVMRQSIAGC